MERNVWCFDITFFLPEIFWSVVFIGRYCHKGSDLLSETTGQTSKASIDKNDSFTILIKIGTFPNVATDKRVPTF
jgi:hypothetical protein